MDSYNSRITSRQIDIEEGEIEETCEQTPTNTNQQINTNESILSLDDEIIKMGWEQHFSKRENRNYYYNKYTKKSVWSREEIFMV